MFTGLVEAVGQVTRLEAGRSGTTLGIAAALGAALSPGESVAVSGVCLTVTSADSDGFSAVVSPETLRVTTLHALVPGRLVNLERPLRADARVGGHFVLGHVDGVGRIQRLSRDGDCYWLDVEVPADLLSLIVSKGSIAVDGISLTVAALAGSCVGLQIVPFTFATTSLRQAQAGDAVNLEGDVIAKYVARWLDDRAGVGVVSVPEGRRS